MKPRQARAGFTLVELLVVIAIIGIFLRADIPKAPTVPRTPTFNPQQAMTRNLCLCLFTVGLFASSSLAENPKNVVFVISDDQGYGDRACKGNLIRQFYS